MALVNQRTQVAQCAAAAEQRLNGGYAGQGYGGYNGNGYPQQQGYVMAMPTRAAPASSASPMSSVAAMAAFA